MHIAKSEHLFSQSRKPAMTLFAMPRRRRPSESKSTNKTLSLLLLVMLHSRRARKSEFSAENYALYKKQ
jgi:hypothetical protein